MLAANAKGSIINIASVLGFGVSKGTIAYATAKAGVIQMTKALGLELAFKGVRVNAIAPGWFVTDINREYLSSEAGREASPATFRSAASARTAISTARCCCSPRTPAATWREQRWCATAARSSRCGELSTSCRLARARLRSLDGRDKPGHDGAK